MKHRGEIVEKVVRQSGMSLTAIAKGIGYTRGHLYNFFDDPELSLDIIINIGKVIKHDFSLEFPESLTAIDEVKEERVTYNKTSNLDDCIKEKEDWRNKYYALMEEYNTLLKTMKP